MACFAREATCTSCASASASLATGGRGRVTQMELRATFTEGWRIDSIDAAHFATKVDDAPSVEAWLAAMTRR